MAKEEVKEKLGKVKGKGSSLLGEFKTFIARGNVLDMAVGVIIGAAFGKIVTSLTDNILMPIIGVIIGNLDFTTLSIKVSMFNRVVNIRYGLFLQNTVDFLITAFCIFLMVKTINKFMALRKKEEAEVEAPIKTDEAKLLEEIIKWKKNRSKNKIYRCL